VEFINCGQGICVVSAETFGIFDTDVRETPLSCICQHLLIGRAIVCISAAQIINILFEDRQVAALE
jgi:hypothetical protein